MAAPLYLTPQYITYDMVQVFLAPIINVTDDLTDDQSGSIYIGAIQTLIAQAETEVINDVLSNYLALPLQGVNGESFDALYDNVETREYSYIPIRTMFINCALYFIYRQYLADGANTNGQALYDNAKDKYESDRKEYRELNIAKNPRLKNAFRGMKRVDNFSRRIPLAPGAAVGIPDGADQGWAAQNSLLNLRY
jgi:hypothetical protein